MARQAESTWVTDYITYQHKDVYPSQYYPGPTLNNYVDRDQGGFCSNRQPYISFVEVLTVDSYFCKSLLRTKQHVYELRRNPALILLPPKLLRIQNGECGT